MDDKKIKEELKPCPFCGSKVMLSLDPMFGSDSTEEYWRINCSCNLGTPDALYGVDKKEDIIKDWNTRAAERLAKIEALEEILNTYESVISDSKTLQSVFHDMLDQLKAGN